MSLDHQEGPEKADIWSQDHNNKFANRTITWAFTAFAIIAVGAFALFFPFSGSDKNVLNEGDANLLVNIDPDTGEEVGVLAKVFNDVTEGIEMNISTARGKIETYVALEALYNDIEKYNDDYRFSFYDTLDSNIVGAGGENAGELHDILVNRETGKANAIIVNDDDSYYGNDLTALKFQKIHYQEPNGDIQMVITETRFDRRKDFDYTNYNRDEFVSLKSLRHGQVIDDRGEYVGEIDAIIYQDAEVQDIFFFVKSGLTPSGQPRLMKIPFETIDLVARRDGFDIKLTKEETRALAKTLYTN